jgi:alkanesulfonate monooxygenase SsuD/methylene tetrahydromethanopterin reductase-like flavin-dependent oxidoreductase (luciferase family)
MKIDIQIPNAPIPQQLEMFQRAEDLGYAGAGLPDHLERGDDCYTMLALAASRTQSIPVFPCVTNPLSRHAWVIANFSYTMESMFPGRLRLVMGAGDSVPAHLGRPSARVDEMRKAVTSIKALLEGENVSFRDTPDEGILGDPLPNRPPVVVAAGGRRLTELAGEVGDEAFLLTGFDPRILAMANRNFATGAKRSGRSLEGFKVTHYTVVRIEPDREKALEFGRSRLMGWLQSFFFKDSLIELGVPESALANPESIPADELDRLVDAFFLIGSVERVAERIEEVRASNMLDRLLVTLMTPSGWDGPAGWQETSAALAKRVLK